MPKRRDDYDYGYDDYYYSQPIKPKDGIQSRSQRGAFAANWWAKRWLDVLEGYGIGSRLQRGRSYARGGQVVSIDVQPGVVASKVQGSRPTPYKVQIKVKALSDAEWERVYDAISAQAIFAAQLLDGQMPQEIETVFKAANVPLFPETIRDITTDCSCPDAANPCKHIAAVYYLLGEQFDVDPFLIFTLRGRTREQVIEALRARRAAAVGEATGEEVAITEAAVPSLTEQIADYWGDEALSGLALPAIAAPEIDAAMLRRLGAPPGEIKRALETIYRAMTARALAKAFGGDGEQDDASREAG